MNRRCYRLVFNPHRRMLMAVEETATGRGKGREAGSRAGTRGTPTTPTTAVRFAVPTLVLSAWIAAGLPVDGWAQVVADPNAGAHRPTIGQTANGLPQVDITRPSGAGVSINDYSRFDVPKSGVILNNSPTAIATRQAGFINGNANLLPGGSARIIVNQVTSANPSQLRGYLEVAGPRSEVIVANPNGILVDGAGFINTSRATLTTGAPVYGGSGSLDAFRVTAGQISVNGDGLNAANVDQVDLIARAVQVNAALYANQLGVVAGANDVRRDTLAATPVTGAGPAPSAGIDVAELGGMYANKILLASTEHGVGVSLRGVAAAQAGDLRLTSAGRLVLAGQASASANVVARARDGIDHTGTTYGMQDVSIETGGALSNSGTLAAQGGMSIAGSSVASTGTLAAGVSRDGTAGAPADLSVVATAGTLSATGQNQASGNVTLQGAGLDLAGSQTVPGGNLDLRAGPGDLDLSGATATAGGKLSANAAGALSNDRGQMASHGDMSLAAGSVSNRGGQIGTQGSASMAAARFDNRDGAVQAAGALSLVGPVALDNRKGLLYGGKRFTLDHAGATLANAGGQVLGGTDVTIRVASLDNLKGAIKANRDVTVAGAVSGSGEMAAGSNLSLDVAGDYENDADNRLRADGDMRVLASGKLTNTGTLAAVGGLTVQGAEVVNAGGAGMVGSSTTVEATQSLANAGRIEGDTVRTHAATTTNTGTIIGNDVTVQGGSVVNHGPAALVAAVRNLHVYATDSVRNLDGATLYSAGDLQIARDGERDAQTGLLVNQMAELVNRSATIEAEGDIDIAATEVSNTRTSIVTEAGTPTTTTKKLKLWQAGLTGRDLQYYASITFPAWRWGTENASVSTPQTDALRTPITVTVDKRTVANLDTGKRSLSFLEAPIELFHGQDPEKGCNMETYVCSRALTTLPTQYFEAIRDNGDTYSITFWPDFDPEVHIRPDEVRQKHIGTDHNEILRTITTTTATDRLVSASDPARIQAGGAIRMQSRGGKILNHASIMAAGGDLVRVADAGAVQDIGTALQRTVTTTETSTLYWHQRTGRSESFHDIAYPTTPQAPTTVASLPAIATANQAVKTSGQAIDITTVNRAGETVTGGDGGGTGRQEGMPDLRLPANGLYRHQTAPGDTYLIATDPRFTQYSQFISSDYMLGQLGLDPMQTQKRLGDGYYEARLIRDQVTQLTGRTFLGAHGDNLAQYQALMDSGVAHAGALNLTPGVGLSADQMSQLTSDMVWMVSQDVTLPDGTQQSVLVPKVYLAQASTVDLQGAGALVSGKQVSLQAAGAVANSGRIVGDLATQVVGTNVVNQGTIGAVGTTLVAAQEDVRNVGGRIAGTDTLVTAGRDVINAAHTITNTTTLANGNSASATGVGAAGSISATNSVGVLAGRDIDMAGGSVNAGQDALLGAGRDLSLGTATTGTTQDASANGGSDFLRERTSTGVGSHVQAGGSVTAVAGRDASLIGSAIGAGGNATLLAGRDATVTASLDTQSRESASFSNKRSQSTASSFDETARGSAIQAGSNATLGAGQTAAVGEFLQANGIAPVDAGPQRAGNVAILGSSVSTGTADSPGGAVALVATGDIGIGTVTERHASQSWSQSKTSGFMSKSETTKTASSRETVAVGSVVSGDAILGTAGRDLAISGSTVAATQDLGLEAGRNLSIAAAESTSESSSYSRTRASGFGATGGGLSYGSRDQKDTYNDSAVTQTGSLVGSTDGNVSLRAGTTLRVTGSQLIAAKDLKGVGADVVIEAAKGKAHHDETHEIKQTGLTLGVSGGALGSAINAGQKVGSASKSQDGRASALWGIAAGRDAYDAARGAGDAVNSLAGGGLAGTAITLSLGTSKSKTTLTQDSTTHTGSNVQAGGKAVFIATGTDADGNQTAGNLDIIGSGVSGTHVGLAARGQVNVVSATDTYESHSTNKSSSGSIGVSYGAQGFGVSVSGSKSKGNSDTTGTTQVNSRVTGSESVSIVSGGDTNILGGVVSGGKVAADIGGNLNLASRQDTEETKARQQSMGGGLSFSQGGGLSGSFSASKGKADGSYANVAEQSGIRAGDGGFDIRVKGNTDLKGAVIASRADREKNKLTTGTVSWSDIENKSDFKGTSFGVAGGLTFGPKVKDETSGQTSGKNTGGVSPMIPQSESGSQRGIAQSGIAQGSIDITDAANQQQDVATLNRDTTDTNSGVGKGPNLEDLLNKQADMMSAAQAAGEAVAKSVGDIAGSKLKDAAAEQKKAQQAFDADPSEENRAGLAKATADVEGWKEGGDYRAALHAAGGAMIAGLGGGNALAGAVGAGASSLAAGKLASLGQSVADGVGSGNANLDEAIGNLAANVLAGGIGAAVGGGSGAATGANADRFNRQLHQTEYDLAAKNAKVVAEKLGISLEEAEGRIVAEILRNSDERTANAAGGKHDYDVRKIVGCQNLNCNGSTEAEYVNHDFNRELIPVNRAGYDLGQSQVGAGQTYNELVEANMKKDPVGPAVLGLGLVGMGYLTGGSGTAAGIKLFGAGISGGANYLAQPENKSWMDIGISTAIGFITTGSGLGSSLGTSAGGALFGATQKGENPNAAVAGAVGGAVAGYGMGKAIVTPVASTIDPRGWWTPDWIDVGHGILKWNSPSAIPGIAAGTGAGFFQEPIGNWIKNKAENLQK
ncbi:two-partner secretion domain-containing protein [Cupriavidus agavae]|uniref:Filamentous hemagglutinin n=1 Tax=Cupriavidus agavae TaxID=1001822 RepID=A0A4V2FGG2_9BURK|nr:hemagglutinin repeat-containing protein [Cupriavidus agavae]RZT36669.1 filamentous hemagglutinin [Cupriavidus agavae]